MQHMASTTVVRRSGQQRPTCFMPGAAEGSSSPDDADFQRRSSTTKMLLSSSGSSLWWCGPGAADSFTRSMTLQCIKRQRLGHLSATHDWGTLAACVCGERQGAVERVLCCEHGSGSLPSCAPRSLAARLGLAGSQVLLEASLLQVSGRRGG